MSNKIEKK